MKELIPTSTIFTSLTVWIGPEPEAAAGKSDEVTTKTHGVDLFTEPII